MRIYHFVLLFIIFFLVAAVRTDASIGRLRSIENEKREITASLSSATSDAVNNLSKTGSYGAGSINKNEVVSVFFASLYSSLGIISDPYAQRELDNYIPVILLCDVDGYYVYYFEEYKATDGYTYIERRWSEKFPYSFEDEYFIYRFTLTDMVYVYDKNNLLKRDEKVIGSKYREFSKNAIYTNFRNAYRDCLLLNDEKFELIRKSVITDKLEDVMAYYTSRHNLIANRQGITYSYSFPRDKKDEWAEYIGDVGLIVVFQGYPYGPDRNYAYNKTASAGANVIKKHLYYVEEKSWYFLAHRQGCDKLNGNNMVLSETFDTIEDCVKLGAYCCECIDYGARVPAIN